MINNCFASILWIVGSIFLCPAEIFAGLQPDKEFPRWELNKVAQLTRAEQTTKQQKTWRSDKLLRIYLEKPTRDAASWVSPAYPADPLSYYRARFVLKLDKVNGGIETWHRGAFTVQYFNAQGRYLGKRDLIRAGGTLDTSFQQAFVPFPHTHSMRFLLSLVGTAGTISLTQFSYESEALPKKSSSIPGIAFVPKPWRAVCADTQYAVSDWKTSFKGDLSTQVKKTLALPLNERLKANTTRSGAYKVHWMFHRIPRNSLSRLPPELAHDEGYSISYKIKAHAITIDVSSTSARGLYYAAQTLGQMVDLKSRRLTLCAVRDYPSLALRGLGTGKFNVSYVKQLAQLKINHIEYSNTPGIWRQWHMPLLPLEAKRVRHVADALNEHFVDGAFGVWPGAFGDTYEWSNPAHYQTLEQKFLYYREQGWRSILVIVASDYSRVGRGNGIVAKVDHALQLDLVTAHADFMRKVELLARRKGMKVYFIPFYYTKSRESTVQEATYLRQAAQFAQAAEVVYGGDVSSANMLWLKRVFGRALIARIPFPEIDRIHFGKDHELDYRGLLRRQFEGIKSDQLQGIVIETPADTKALEHAADFLWNYGR